MAELPVTLSIAGSKEVVTVSSEGGIGRDLADFYH